MGFEGRWKYRDCPWCGVRSVALIEQVPVSAPNDNVGVRFWTILSCPRCGGVVCIEHNAHDIAANNFYRILPSGGASEVAVSDLPTDVAHYYSSAVRVLEAGVPDAAAVQLRKTLEAAAAHFGVTDGPLVRRIQALISDGLITKAFAAVLHHVRQVGNVGAHAGDATVDNDTAIRALRFTTQILRNLFEVPAELARAANEKEAPTVDEAALHEVPHPTESTDAPF